MSTPEELLPYMRSLTHPQFARPTRTPLMMSDLINPNADTYKPAGDWAQMRSEQADAGDLIGRAIRAAVGYPEKLLSGETSQLDTPFGSVMYPTGLPDAAAMLPLGFSTALRGGKMIQSAAGDTIMPFFSQLAKTITERMPLRAAPEQVMNIARKGSKAEELAWSGLEDFLAGKKTATKDEVLQHLQKNAPDLKERMIGDPVPRPMTWRDTIVGPNQGMSASEDGMVEIRPNRQGSYEIFRTDHAPGSGMDYVGYANTIDEAKRMAEQRAGVSALKPKFTNYTLPGGGENHRELVVTLPSKEVPPKDFQELKDLTTKGLTYETTGDARYRLTDEEENRLSELYEKYPDSKSPDMKNAYHVPAGHAYGDPELDVNRLFHARMNDRTTVDGEKALNLEELQSDWHQTGRKEGYNKNFEDPEYSEQFDELDHEFENGNITDEDYEEQLEELQRQSNTSVPDAPFKNTWHELGMKRMLQEAAAGGYDRLTWTTGAQQADRYSLANYVDELEYKRSPDTISGTLYGSKEGRSAFTPLSLTHGELEQHVGKELAGKLIDKGRVETPDMKIGGEGMDDFYGYESEKIAAEKANGPNGKVAMLPAYAKKFGKRYGVEPEMVDLPGVHKPEDVDEAERRYAESELQSESEYINKLKGDDLKEAHDAAFPPDQDRFMRRSDGTEWSENEMRQRLYDFRENYFTDHRNAPSVDDLIDFGYLDEPEPQKVWSIKITPEMRRDLLEKGQPTFSAPVPLPAKKNDQKPLFRPSDFRLTGR